MKDWLIGAAAMLLALAVGITIAWWGMTDPAGSRETTRVPAPSGVDPRVAPPADLGADQVWFAELALDTGTLVTAGSTLRNVRAVGQDVVTGPDGLVAARVIVEATVPFGVVADELGGDAVVRPAGSGEATVIRTVEALGRELRVAATGTVDVVRGRLVVEPTSIDVGGPGFLSDATADVVRQLVTIEHELEGLPDGLVLQDVGVQSDGFRAHLRGTEVALVP